MKNTTAIEVFLMLFILKKNPTNDLQNGIDIYSIYLVRLVMRYLCIYICDT